MGPGGSADGAGRGWVLGEDEPLSLDQVQDLYQLLAEVLVDNGRWPRPVSAETDPSITVRLPTADVSSLLKELGFSRLLTVKVAIGRLEVETEARIIGVEVDKADESNKTAWLTLLPPKAERPE